ncbi:MAG: glycosyltransferase, partial [Ignavibacteriales bacterium]|nr:glycosyltransferase [Ignavibacteriales bacterium]
PASYSHFSRPVVEAWGFAKPVVVAATPHMNRLITQGMNGILVPPGDHEAIAKAIETLLDDGRLRKTMGLAGKQKVAEEFQAAKNTQILIECCDRLLECTQERNGA